jgi:hypothetical protein
MKGKPLKKKTKKISLRGVRLEGIKFTTSSKAGNYPSIPISPEDLEQERKRKDR